MHSHLLLAQKRQHVMCLRSPERSLSYASEVLEKKCKEFQEKISECRSQTGEDLLKRPFKVNIKHFKKHFLPFTSSLCLVRSQVYGDHAIVAAGASSATWTLRAKAFGLRPDTESSLGATGASELLRQSHSPLRLASCARRWPCLEAQEKETSTYQQ